MSVMVNGVTYQLVLERTLPVSRTNRSYAHPDVINLARLNCNLDPLSLLEPTKIKLSSSQDQ